VKRPTVLVLAGLEPTGRAGLFADLATVRALGAVGVGLATALTAQGLHTFDLRPTSPSLLARQIRAAREVSPIHAVKLGMIPTRASLRALRDALSDLDVPWVVDPVVRTSAGEPLSQLSAQDYLRLASVRTALTPNLDEAAWLLGEETSGKALPWAEAAAARLVESGFGAAVVKGGHGKGRAVDVARVGPRAVQLAGPRLPRQGLRGTGCRFASALAVGWARTGNFLEAAAEAKRVVVEYLRGGAAG